METLLHGSLTNEGLEVVQRDAHYFVRYDAGSHLVQWREDEITEEEFRQVADSKESCVKVMFEIQKRLIATGVDPYTSNWNPS